MKLLFDENLSPALPRLVADLYPGSDHVVRTAGEGSTDLHVWSFAARHGYAVVSKDNDFRQLSFTAGPPPKVVWLSVGNAGTRTIAHLLRARLVDLLRFDDDPDVGLLVVSP